jgi:HAD superfamily hydrolase (TIGR01509 family)
MGRRWPDNQARIRAQFGRPLPEDFFTRYSDFENGRMRREVNAVAGVQAFFAAHRAHKFCVASSSSISWLDHGVDKFDMRGTLGRNLFSATEVKNGKPAPDIFLHAAARMGVAPEKCAVLEDSAAGVQGGVAAGMMTIGFLGGAHIRAGHGEMLETSGAHALARDYGDVARILKLGGAAA